MPPVSHQTIKLTKGKHTSPVHGACVMELASMLAGEPFSDHPRSVSPPLAAFLRGYNDLVDDARRQDLYAYAAGAVGTASGPRLERARAARLIRWGDERWGRGRSWRLLRRIRRPRFDGARGSELASAGGYAVHSIARVTDRTHASVLALLDELIAIGGHAPPPSVPFPEAIGVPEAVAGNVTLREAAPAPTSALEQAVAVREAVPALEEALR